MATQAKKPPPPPVEDAADTSTPVPYAVPVTPEPEPAPELVEPYRVLNDDQVRRVNAIKTHFGDSVVYLQTLRNAYHASETLQAIDVAIVHAETASMWAVRAVTKAV